MLFEIRHKDKIWINVGQRFFISCMIIFGHINRIVYCIDTSSLCVHHKTPSLRGDRYISEIHDLHNLYMSALFVDHNPNYAPTLEDIITFTSTNFTTQYKSQNGAVT